MQHKRHVKALFFDPVVSRRALLVRSKRASRKLRDIALIFDSGRCAPQAPRASQAPLATGLCPSVQRTRGVAYDPF